MDSPTWEKLILLASFLIFLKIIELSQNVTIVQSALVSSGESQTQTGLHSKDMCITQTIPSCKQAEKLVESNRPLQTQVLFVPTFSRPQCGKGNRKLLHRRLPPSWLQVGSGNQADIFPYLCSTRKWTLPLLLIFTFCLIRQFLRHTHSQNNQSLGSSR